MEQVIWSVSYKVAHYGQVPDMKTPLGKCLLAIPINKHLLNIMLCIGSKIKIKPETSRTHQSLSFFWLFWISSIPINLQSGDTQAAF